MGHGTLRRTKSLHIPVLTRTGSLPKSVTINQYKNTIKIIPRIGNRHHISKSTTKHRIPLNASVLNANNVF
jgi:hypothetical protein